MELTEGLLPVGAGAAAAMGLIDAAFGATGRAAFRDGGGGAGGGAGRRRRLRGAAGAKAARRRRDEASKPLAAYRAEELAHMQRSFYGPDPAFHEARHRFVHKLPPDGPATVRRLRGPLRGRSGASRMAPGACRREFGRLARRHSRVDSRPASRNPSTVSSATALPPCANASGIIVSASIVSTAPAAKACT